MKTSYKIFLVIGIFIAFYFAIIPIFQLCLDSEVDCDAVGKLVFVTRPVIFVDIWDDSNDIGGWSSKVKSIEEEHTAIDYLGANIPFLLTMVVIPSVIISGIVIRDKRK